MGESFGIIVQLGQIMWNAEKSPMNELWSEILTAAVNLPTGHPAKESALIALEEASRRATEAVDGKASIFSPSWYSAAVQAIQTADPAAQRFFIAQMSKAYRRAYAEIAWRKDKRRTI